jgi:hypothetical protein
MNLLTVIGFARENSLGRLLNTQITLDTDMGNCNESVLI